MTHKHSSPIVVQAFAAPFARYPGYVISATRSRDQHVIVIVLTRPASTDSRLVRKLAHAQHHAAPPKRRQNNVKNVTGRKIGVDRPWCRCYTDIVRAKITRDIFGSDYIGPSVDAALDSYMCTLEKPTASLSAAI